MHDYYEFKLLQSLKFSLVRVDNAPDSAAAEVSPVRDGIHSSTRGTLMARRRKPNPTNSTTDIFSPTPRPATVKRRPGRPPVHEEAWTKVTVVLFDRQIVFLDRLAANIREQSGAAISRAQLIRALVDASADADLDLTLARSEADLKRTILARLGRYRLDA